MSISPIPSGYHAITPYLIVSEATKALAWYSETLGARELMRLPGPGGRIGHAEIEIGDSRVMLADEAPEHDAKSPAAFGGSPVTLVLYLAEVDAICARAAASGATVKAPPEDKFYGDRMGTIVDPFGHTWHLATHIEDVPAEELQRRLEKTAGAA
jgi:PhnB protein